jgi:hypothetical protein
MEFKNLEKILHMIGEKSVQDYKNGLLKNNHFATGKLTSNITYVITHNNNIYKLIIKTPANYWSNVEFGRNPFKGVDHPDRGNVNYDENGMGDTTTKAPSFPPLKNLINWIIVKNIQYQSQTINSVRTPNSALPGTADQQTLAFLIGRSIKNKGIKPDMTIYNIREGILKNYSDDIREAIKKDLLEQFQN